MSDEQIPADISAGAMLRRAREASGLHIAALAVGMKVHVKKLEALEADRYETLGDPVFVRALASSMCRSLKLDPGPVLEKLPQYVKPTLSSDKSALNAPFREPGGSALALPSFLKTPTFLIVFLLLIAAVGVVLYPQNTQLSSPPPTTAGAKAPDETANPPVPEPVFVQAPIVSSSSPVAAASATVDAPVVSQAQTVPAGSVSAPVLAAVAAPPAAKVTPVVPAPAPAASVATGSTALLVLRPKEASWVQVIDAKGVVQLRKTLQPGEVASVGGDLPLAVTVGRADATVVEVRGKVMALGAITQDNVARFEVK